MSDVRRSKSYVWCPMSTVRCMMSDVRCPIEFWCPMSDLDVRCLMSRQRTRQKNGQRSKQEIGKKTDKKRAKRSTKIRTKNRTKDRTKNKRNDRTKKWDEKTEHYIVAWGYEFYLRVLKVSNTYVSVPKSQNSNEEEKNYVSNHGDTNILTRER